MKLQTREQVKEYHDHLAQLNGVESVENTYTVAPSVEQSIKEEMGENSDFLAKINIVGVDELKGEPLRLGSSSPVASRTNTTAGKTRATKSAHAITKREYELKKTDFDTHVTYETLDNWAKFGNLAELIKNQRMLQIARDRLMIGWNGTSAADDTDLTANPLCEDVNIGWVSKLKIERPAAVNSTGIKVGDVTGADYKNLDELVYDAVGTYLPSWYQNDTSLRVMCGRKLFKDKMLSILKNTQNKATEVQALQTLYTDEMIGNLPAEIPAFMPERTLAVSSYDNISIYHQNGKQRNLVVDEAKADRIEYYQSSNEAYVIEDENKMFVIEGILLPDGNGGWA